VSKSSGLGNDPRVAWLRQNASRIRSIDPADTVFDDLSALRAAIGDARVVFLGESSHGDGATFLAITRLIKFLHQRMDFDVFVWESGLYDVGKAWTLIQAGVPATTALRERVYALWSETQEVAPLLSYIEQEARSKHPLEVAGMDSKFSGRAGGEGFSADLDSALVAQGLSGSRLQPGSVLHSGFLAMLPMVTQPTIDTAFIDSLVALRRDFAAAMKRATVPGAAGWSRILGGLEEHARFLQIQRELPRIRPDTAEFIRWYNMRDVQMGRNLVWLAREKYQSRKIVVWAASAHLNYGSPNGAGRGFLSAGRLLKEVLGPQVYQIDFISHSGSSFNPFMPEYGNKPFMIEPTTKGVSLEDLLSTAGHRFAFLNLRQPAPGGQWLHEPLWARTQGHSPTNARWAEHTDAFFFIREMRPASALPR
jgi:erythromycin esterase